MSQIQKFYEGINVFITGGNGFIGKILVEKLLRCTNIATIYLLMRQKRGKDVYTRFEEMIENEPFITLKSQRPNFKNQIKLIIGENCLPDLGLTSEDYQQLVSKVDVVFHVAATIRFHENLKTAYETNVGMTRKIISICKQMENLKAFIYVSTAYSNCYLNFIEEVFYDLDFEYSKVEQLLNDKKLCQKILQKWPNTYSFTKAVAELLIRDTCSNLPVGIFRPSIVISTYKEPIEGWTDSFGGPNTLVATVASGFTRFFCCDVNYVVDLVPVDLTVSAMVASAWDIYQQQGTSEIPIYNFVSSVDNPITYDEFIKLNISVHSNRYPFNTVLWTPTVTIMKKSQLFNIFFNTTFHYLPALLIDVVSFIFFKKPNLTFKYRKFNISRYHMEYFMAHEWKFSNTNVKKMWSNMNEHDRKIFNFDLKSLNWISYLRDYYKGIRFYLFKEPWQNLENARLKAKRFKILHNAFLFVIYFIGMSALWSMVTKTIPLRFLRYKSIKK